jgi:hypothetical protein
MLPFEFHADWTSSASIELRLKLPTVEDMYIYVRVQQRCRFHMQPDPGTSPLPVSRNRTGRERLGRATPKSTLAAASQSVYINERSVIANHKYIKDGISLPIATTAVDISEAWRSDCGGAICRVLVLAQRLGGPRDKGVFKLTRTVRFHLYAREITGFGPP